MPLDAHIPRGPGTRSQTRAGRTEPPLVSLIMPIRNEAGFITRSLGAVLAQDYPPERLEIWVADGMSSDSTRSLVGELIAADAARVGATTARVRVIDNPEGIVPTAMNRAMRLARGEVVVRVDGHCEVPRHYVSRAVELLERDGIAGVGGPVETLGSSYAARAISLAMSSAFGVGPGSFRTAQATEREPTRFRSPAYRRDVIEAAGPYDEELVRNQDDEYNYRLRKLGFRLLLSPSLTSRYHGRSSFRGLAPSIRGLRAVEGAGAAEAPSADAGPPVRIRRSPSRGAWRSWPRRR
jgi:succinoglycan biosynthesis protein ExoA